MELSESDGTLIAAVRAGQIDRFDELARRYHGALWRLAYGRLGSRDAADDAVQETFIAAFRWLASYDSRYSFRTWLWTILLNECRRSLARRARRREVSPQAGEEGDSLATLVEDVPPHQRILLQERTEMLERLIRRLPDVEADAVRLRFFGDLKFQEIADVLGCSLSTAKYRVRDGLSRLGQWIAADELSATMKGNEQP